MLEIAVGTLGALAVVAAALLSQPARRALVIHRYVVLLRDLPKGSKQRKRLAKEIDRMVETELETRRFWETSRFVAAIFGFSSLAWIFTDVASRSGGWWWFYAALYWLAALTLVVALIIVSARGARRRKLRRATKKESKPKKATG